LVIGADILSFTLTTEYRLQTKDGRIKLVTGVKCPNCGGLLQELGQAKNVFLEYWDEDIPEEHEIYESLLLHTVFKCDHCHSIWLRVEE